MRRVLAYLLLSIAVVFQGMGAVCAYGPIPVTMGDHAMVMHGMTDAGQGCMSSGMRSGNPADHMTTQTCMQSCSLPANIHSVAFFVPHVLLGDAPSLPPTVSLVDHSQVPPTPPPIA
jgi:hypothetical protein